MSQTSRPSRTMGAAHGTKVPKSVDEYLEALPSNARAALRRLRRTIRAAAPEASEVISYRVPMFKHEGPLVAFAAFPHHLSFFVMSPAVMRAHARELEGYPVATGTIRFYPDQPLPAKLVTRLVKARLAENEARRKL